VDGFLKTTSEVSSSTRHPRINIALVLVIGVYDSGLALRQLHMFGMFGLCVRPHVLLGTHGVSFVLCLDQS
jgi:hypothetical protein